MEGICVFLNKTMSRGDSSIVNILGKHVAEIALGMRIQHGRIQRLQQFAKLRHQTPRPRRDIQLVHRRRRIECTQRIVARYRIAFLLLANGDQGFIDVLELFDESLLDVDREYLVVHPELEFNVHIERTSGFDAHPRHLVRRIIVALDGALGGDGGVAVDVDQREVGEAVFVFLAFDKKENLFAVFAEQVVIRIDLAVIGRPDNDADIADPECFRRQFLEV